MCGIAGIINKSQNPVSEEALRRMNEQISHRGPDGEGFHFYENVGLSHRRLSILDLSKNGHQPMGHEESFFLTFNGEIYNYIEIRKELASLGHKFVSNTDSEVLLKAYVQWKEQCVHKFNGMWAFAILDLSRDIIFFSRDRFGIKPLYYKDEKEGFSFCSEIRPLLSENNVANIENLSDYLLTGRLEHNEKTCFQDITKLLPGHNLIYDLNTHQVNIDSYYDIFQKIGNAQNHEQLEEKLDRSIELRLRSDVTVGTCLSGGIDSSLVASIASKKYLNANDRFKAINAKSIDPKTDESQYAKIVAEKNSIDLVHTTPDFKDFSSSIDEVIKTQEEPFGGPTVFMQYFVMKKAKEEGCIVMLDGQGGDEALLGYNRYFSVFLIHLLIRFRFILFFKELVWTLVNNSTIGIKGILKYALALLSPKIRKSVHLKNAHFLKPDFLESVKLDFLKRHSANVWNVQKFQAADIKYFNLTELLKYEDKNSMHFSIETRLPFLDYHFMESALNQPLNNKIYKGWSKYSLRRILAPLCGSKIAFRKDKFGFLAPSEIWLNQYEPNMLEEIKRSQILAHISDFSKLEKEFPHLENNFKWRLYNIAKWEEVFKVSL